MRVNQLPISQTLENLRKLTYFCELVIVDRLLRPLKILSIREASLRVCEN